MGPMQPVQPFPAAGWISGGLALASPLNRASEPTAADAAPSASDS